jgi:hypothetical protein
LITLSPHASASGKLAEGRAEPAKGREEPFEGQGKDFLFISFRDSGLFNGLRQPLAEKRITSFPVSESCPGAPHFTRALLPQAALA